MTRRVKLLWVEGEDAADFSDLVGATGSLGPGEGGLLFMPEGRGDFVGLEASPRKLTSKATALGHLRVKTRLGNVFVFGAATGPSPSGKGV